MGRMCHTLLLVKWEELFSWLPIEKLIKLRQQECYYNLGIADKKSDSSVFMEFMLKIIKHSVEELSSKIDLMELKNL